MGKVTLPAQVRLQENDYLAIVEKLDLVGKGATVEEAQDDLVGKFMSWVQASEGQGMLEAALLEAGYAEVDEDTELELEFVEQSHDG